MAGNVIADSGSLVALVRRDDADEDFRIYRRHSRQVVPCLLP